LEAAGSAVPSGVFVVSGVVAGNHLKAEPRQGRVDVDRPFAPATERQADRRAALYHVAGFVISVSRDAHRSWEGCGQRAQEAAWNSKSRG